MASTGTRNKHVIIRAIFDFPCALKALKSFVAVDWRVSSLFKRYLGVRIKRSCLRIYRELVSKKFSLQFSRKCVTPSERNRVFSLPCGDLKTLSRVISPSQWIISVKEAKIPFGERKFFRERAKIPFGEHIISYEWAKIPFGEGVNSFGRRITMPLKNQLS